MDQKQEHMSAYLPGPPGDSVMQPGQQHQVVYVQTSPQKPPISKLWKGSRLAFTIVSLIFCPIVLGLLGAIMNISVSGYYLGYIVPFIEGSPPVILAAVWDIAELITICARTGHRGIHPGAHVGLQLIIWLGMAASTAILSIQAILDSDDLSYYSSSSYYGSYSSRTSNTLIPLEAAAAGITGLLTLNHFICFVIACVETHRRNRNRNLNQQQVFFMAPPPGAATAQPEQMQQMQFASPTQTPAQNSVYYPANSYGPPQGQQQFAATSVQPQTHEPHFTGYPPVNVPTPPPMMHGSPSPRLSHGGVVAPLPVYAPQQSRVSSTGQSPSGDYEQDASPGAYGAHEMPAAKRNDSYAQRGNYYGGA